jgi:hypothetical protein
LAIDVFFGVFSSADIDDLAGAAGLLGGENHQMAFQRFVDSAQDKGAVIRFQRPDKRIHEARVSPITWFKVVSETPAFFSFIP